MTIRVVMVSRRENGSESDGAGVVNQTRRRQRMTKGAKSWLSVVALSALGCWQDALANFTCGGPVTYLAVNSVSTLYVSVGGYGIWAICNLSSAAGNGGTTVSVDACRSWYAGLLAQRAQGLSVTMYFSSTANTSNGAECTALPAWSIPNPLPYHVELAVG